MGFGQAPRNLASERGKNLLLEDPFGRRCEVCFKPLERRLRRQGGGRPRTTCSDACKQWKYRRGGMADPDLKPTR
jgi:hypothetical protein